MKIGGSNSDWSVILILIIIGFASLIYFIVKGIIWLFNHVSIS